MKYEGIVQSPNEVLNGIYQVAYDNLGITILDLLDGAKDWNCVRQEVSRMMIYRLKGRPIPLNLNTLPLPNREGYKYSLSGLFLGAYPRHLKKPIQKAHHLKNKYEKGEIDLNMFLDFGTKLGFETKRLIKLIEDTEFG